METVVNLADAVRRGERTATEVLDQHAAAIGAADDKLNAFVHLDLDLARQAAEEVDARRARGEDPGPLAGVPFGVKDLENCAGMPTSYGSLLFKGRPPVTADSVHVRRLRAAGAVPVGKTATPEFGTVCFTSTRAWGTTANPWDLDRTPGGSSGGSAAAVAAGLVPFCTASDGGGSTRIPAAFSGLVGFKASYGRIPHPDAAPSQTTCPGALTTTVADAARHLDVAAGPDDRDRVSLPPAGVVFERAIEELDVAGLRAAWSPDLGFAVVEPEVTELTESAALALAEAAGLELVDRPVTLTDPVRTWLTSGAGDLWMDLEEGMYPEQVEDMDPLTRLALDATADVAMPRYARILRRRAQLEDEVAAIFRDVDVLLTPATAVPAFAAAGPMPTEIAGEKVHPAMVVPFTMVGNLCWNPAVSVPSAPTEAGLPAGLQVMGRRHADATVLRLARIYEQVRPWTRVAPRPFARSA
jgi:aspartyl-tRNA(Asn)/glutamyl-tRNA(Gln) amidotransferase subunit A